MNKRSIGQIAILVIGILAAVVLFKNFGQNSQTSVPTEVIQVPADETPSDGGLVSREQLKAAGDKLVAGATDFGSDCKAAEDYFHATGGDARCKQEGSDLEIIISSEGLPQDPAELSAEQPIAP